MRHGGRAFLAFGKKLLRFQHFGSLQMPDLGCKPLQRGRNDTKGRKKHCVAIARNDLRRGGLDGKPEFFRDIGFDARIDIRISADGAGNRAGRDFLPRMNETFAGAQKFGIGLRELQPEGHGLGVDAMRAADRGGELVFERAAF